jgi:predicted DNA-binding ribbon-helix-helix protein
MSSGRKQRKDTESITFRLERQILNKLRHEAAQKDVSINTLVSQIIKQHGEWHSNAAKAGFVSVRKGFLTRLMEKLPEQEVSFITEQIAKKETKDFVMLLRNEYTLESALSVLECWVRICGFPFRHENTDTIHSYVIQHEMGKKMSNYTAELYRNLFHEFFLKKVHFDLTDNAVSFVVDLMEEK